MRLTAIHTPQGAHDILPQEACRKAWVETRISKLFASWGYVPVVTPTMEFFDSLAIGNGPGLAAHTYRFLERDGSTLALRPEITTPIARMVTTRMRDERKPLRLHYVGSVFRYDQLQAGRQREFTQAGVELIGAPGPRADAEIVALAVKAMRSVGLQGFCVDIGHAGFFAGLLAAAQVDAQVQDTLRQKLIERDFVALQETVRQAGVNPDVAQALVALSSLRGGLEVLDQGARLAPNSVSLAALDNLRTVYRLLTELGVADAVAIDLGLVKDLEYYTGLVLEGYTREIGFTLCTGGRYDGLLGRFGYDCPATGFALGVERVLLALERQHNLPDVTPEPAVIVGASPERFGEAAAYADFLRSQGYAVALDVLAAEIAEDDVPGRVQILFTGKDSADGVRVQGSGGVVTKPVGDTDETWRLLQAELLQRLGKKEGR